MYVGPEKNGGRIASWLDYPSYHAAADAGAINLRQDVRMLGDVVGQSVQGAVELVERGQLNPGRIDWLVVHYSSQVFIGRRRTKRRAEGVRDPARTLVHQSAVDGQHRVGFDFRAAGRAAVFGEA